MSEHDAFRPPDAQSAAGDIADRLRRALGSQYTVRRLLGRGGFAEVFEVLDQGLDRRLAVKVLRPDVAWTSGMLARFRQEAKAVARLTHPNILPIYFVAEGEGLVYYAMPFVEGQSLGDLLRSKGALDVDRALKLIHPVLEALHHAHKNGFVHRDIKPDNVMVEGASGRVLLMDFGIAKQLDQGKGLTQTGFVVGTPHYMSPEQALGQPNIDARSDLYSVGAMLFQMVTGSPPFEGDTSQEIVAKHISEPPPVPRDLNARIPKWLSDVIIRCLAKRPGERYQSAAMVLDALDVGRVSGGGESVSAELVARQIRGESDTTPMPAAPNAGAQPNANQESSGRRWPLVVGGLALTALGALLAARALAPPTLLLENRLVAPIQVAVNGKEYAIPPGGERRIRLKRRSPLAAQWHSVRPTTPDGTGMGVEVQGAIVDDRPRSTLRHAATNRAGGTAYFAPLITNAGNEPLAITVNAGLVANLSCGCRVPPGATRVPIGYYPLFSNSSVQARDPRGRTATFRDLGSRVDPETGTVGLRFETPDLR